MSNIVTALDINGNKYEVDAKGLTWRPSAYGVVIKDGSVLLLRQQTGYDLPGGGIDLGEDLEVGLIREVKEESGVEVKSLSLLGIKTQFFKMPSNGKFVHSLMLYYKCEYVGGDISTDGFDEWEKQYALTTEWYPLEKMDELKVASSVDFRPFIRKFL